MKRMKHPQHGFHHAYSPQEEAVMRGNGWIGESESFAGEGGGGTGGNANLIPGVAIVEVGGPAPDSGAKRRGNQ